MTPRAAPAIALRAFLAAVAIGMCLGLLVILGVVDDERPLATSVIIAMTCLLTFALALVADNGRFARWMRAGMRVAWVAAAGWITVVWIADGVGWTRIEPFARALGALGAFAGWTALSGVTLFARSGGAAAAAVRWTAFGLLTGGLAAAIAGLAFPHLAAAVVVGIVGEDFAARIAASAVVLFLGCSIAQPVLVRLASAERTATDPRLGDRHVGVRVRCPRCMAESEIAANTAAACPGCRLLLRIQFEEPRCACGFLIYRLEAANCPECGKPVPEGLRWRAEVTPSRASPPSP